MSAIPGFGGHDLAQRSLPPRKQRILAPSTVTVEHTGGYAPRCVCTLIITDPVNLAIYYVPCTPQMATAIRELLAQHDPEHIKAEQQGRFPE